MNAGAYFEIPVTDLDRAVAFYEAVFEIRLERTEIDGYAMALFPFDESKPGITGALAKGDVYLPSKTGTIVYLATLDIDRTLERVIAQGGKILYAKKMVSAGLYVAEFEDSEGNRIALSSRK
jgi:predicted enzyme related to lactoylglutathione lyase